MKKRIRVLFDASVIANGAKHNSGRTGIFFAAYNVLKEFIKRDDIIIELYSGIENYTKAKSVIENDEIFRGVKFTDDYNLWPAFTWMLLIFAMISGGCTGSTSGGVKNVRLLIMFQNIKNQFKQMLHPRAVLPVHINNSQVPVQTTAMVYTFFVTLLNNININQALQVQYDPLFSNIEH